MLLRCGRVVVGLRFAKPLYGLTATNFFYFLFGFFKKVFVSMILLHKPIYKRLAILSRRTFDFPLIEKVGTFFYAAYLIDTLDIILIDIKVRNLLFDLFKYLFLPERM